MVADGANRNRVRGATWNTRDFDFALTLENMWVTGLVTLH